MNKILKVTLVVLSALVLMIASCSPSSTPQGTEIGSMAPDFQLVDITQQPVSLSDFRGKPVVLNFWATWCGPCVFEMPVLQEIYEEYSDEGLTLLAINIGESPSRVEKFLQSNNLSLPVLLDTGGVVAQQYNAQFIPTTFFIDGDGIIQEKRIGPFIGKRDIEDKLDKIMPSR